MTFQNCGALGQALGFPEAEVERVGRRVARNDAGEARKGRS